MSYDYKCPICECEFKSELKNGYIDCPECEEELELIEGIQAYSISDDDDDDEDEEFDDEDEDSDDKDTDNE